MHVDSVIPKFAVDVPLDMSGLRFDTFARDLAQLCPSIRTVAITGHVCEDVVWIFNRADGKMRVARLGGLEGRRVLEEEARRYPEAQPGRMTFVEFLSVATYSARTDCLAKFSCVPSVVILSVRRSTIVYAHQLTSSSYSPRV